MPVRDGRWVSYAQLAKSDPQTEVVTEPDDDDTVAVPERAGRRVRRSKRAAEAAILDATGMQVELANDPAVVAESLPLATIEVPLTEDELAELLALDAEEDE